MLDIAAKKDKPKVQSRKSKAAKLGDKKNWEYTVKVIDNGFVVRKRWTGDWSSEMTQEQREGVERYYTECPLNEMF